MTSLVLNPSNVTTIDCYQNGIKTSLDYVKDSSGNILWQKAAYGILPVTIELRMESDGSLRIYHTYDKEDILSKVSSISVTATFKFAGYESSSASASWTDSVTTSAFTINSSSSNVRYTDINRKVYGGHYYAVTSYTIKAVGFTDATGKTAKQMYGTPVDIPSPNSGLVYNGAEQIGVNDVGNFSNRTGDYKATKAGSYQATVKLQDTDDNGNYAKHYYWKGTNNRDDQLIPWTIGKLKLSALFYSCEPFAVDTDHIIHVRVKGKFLMPEAFDICTWVNTYDKKGNLVSTSKGAWAQEDSQNTGSFNITHNQKENIAINGDYWYSITCFVDFVDSTQKKNYDTSIGSSGSIYLYSSKVKLGTALTTYPTANDLTYTGSKQTGITTSTYWSLSGHQQTAVGTYTGYASLKSDYLWYYWADTEDRSKRSVTWSIGTATCPFPAPNSSGKFTGNTSYYQPAIYYSSGTVDGATKNTLGVRLRDSANVVYPDSFTITYTMRRIGSDGSVVWTDGPITKNVKQNSGSGNITFKHTKADGSTQRATNSSSKYQFTSFRIQCSSNFSPSIVTYNSSYLKAIPYASLETS